MYSPEEIIKEVKSVFGDDVRVDVKFSANIDGYFIEVHKIIGNEEMMVQVCISALEELQARDPLELLRAYIKQMWMYFQEAMKEEHDKDLRNARRQIGRKDPRGGNGSNTYH